ncbi:MAG: hypothetical protein JST68_29685 [Bacteroidetes bacterium]|nr:hypothetical protein [Bacteroidota bacterium]
MKPLPILAFLCLLLHHASAQRPNLSYELYALNGGMLYPRHPGKDVALSFPYTIIPDAGGGPSSQTFNGSLGHSYAGQSYVGDIFSIEIARRHHSVDLGMGVNQEVNGVFGFYLKEGYRYLLPLKGVMLKAGFDLYCIFDSGNKLGSIDNKNQEIDLFGFQAMSQWTETSTDDQGVNTTDTYYANTLDVLYRRNSILGEPKIALTTTGKHVAFGLEAGWRFQLAQDAVIKLRQSGSNGNTNTVGGFPMNNNGSLGGPYIALTIGGYMWHKKSP